MFNFNQARDKDGKFASGGGGGGGGSSKAAAGKSAKAKAGGKAASHGKGAASGSSLLNTVKTIGAMALGGISKSAAGAGTSVANAKKGAAQEYARRKSAAKLGGLINGKAGAITAFIGGHGVLPGMAKKVAVKKIKGVGKSISKGSNKIAWGVTKAIIKERIKQKLTGRY